MSRPNREAGGFAVVKMESRDADGFRFRSNRLGDDPVEDTVPPTEDRTDNWEGIPSSLTLNHAGGFQVIVP